MTEDTSKSILGLYYMLRIAMTMCVALCVMGLHFYFNTFKDKKLDEMMRVDEKVREIKTNEDMKANIENVAMAVMKSGTEDKVRLG